MGAFEIISLILNFILSSGILWQFMFYRQKRRQEVNRTNSSTLENLEKLFSSIYGEMIEDMKKEISELRTEVKEIKTENKEKDKIMRQMVSIARKCNDCKILEIV